MNTHLFVLTLFFAILCIAASTNGAKSGKSKTAVKTTTNNTNSKQIAIGADNDLKKFAKLIVSADKALTNTTTTTTTKAITDKTSYPKKVHSLKKRPTTAKTPTTHAAIATSQALSNGSKSKRKKVIDVTSIFKDLPADDVEFIKELDKQFQLHGDKIKIKVERVNGTEGREKQTSKRTIEGELGYGAQHLHTHGYLYAQPKFQFYPYSQQNIAADAPGYYPPKTDVSIEPSYSYELEPQTYVEKQETPPKILDVPHYQQQQSAPGAHQHEEQGGGGGYEEPVIVLRIPGPTKYASHLQTLLQQYLEIRAAQYLRILEEAEKQQYEQQQQQQHQQQKYHLLQQQEHQQQHHQQHEHEQQQQYEQQTYIYEQHAQHKQNGAVAPAQAYLEPTAQVQPPQAAQQQEHIAHHQAPSADDEQNYAPQVEYVQQVTHVAPQAAVSYPEIDQVYQSYKSRLHQQEYGEQEQQQQQEHVPHQQQQEVVYVQQQQQQQEAPEQQNEHNHQQQQQYYVQAAAQQPDAQQQYYYVPIAQVGAHDSHQYQNIYFMAIAPQAVYDEQDTDTHSAPAAHATHAAHAAHDAALHHQTIYVKGDEQESHQPHQQQQHQEHGPQHELIAGHAATALSENNPRKTHTKAIYTHNTEKGAADYVADYTLPSIRPYERHAATSAAYHALQQEHHHHQQQQQQYDYDTDVGDASQHEQLPSAAISPRPYNYHAHSAKASRRRNRKRGTAITIPMTTTTTTAPSTTSSSATPTVVDDVDVDKHLEKIREYVRDNFGAKMSKEVEFKTADVIKS